MLKISVNTRRALDPEKFRMSTLRRIALGTARAADLLTGALKRYSSQGPLHARTGALAQAWQTVATPDPLVYKSINPLVYAAIQETGGTVTPKNAKMLAIPLEAAMTERGVSRYPSAHEAFDAEGLFVLKSGSGQALLAKKMGAGQIEAWYVLKASVEIPASHYATLAIKSIKSGARAEILKALKAK